jgi:hypothetical protein
MELPPVERQPRGCSGMPPAHECIAEPAAPVSDFKSDRHSGEFVMPLPIRHSQFRHHLECVRLQFRLTSRRVLARALLMPALILALATPALSFAQQTMNAQPLTPQGLALAAPELGPEWSVGEHHSSTVEGADVYQVVYTAPSGRMVRVTTAVAPDSDYAEAVISSLRYELERDGATITSVQDQGFGDGRAFRAQFSDGQTVLVSYLFRVRNLIAAVDYRGAAGAGDVPSQAVAAARKQEAKLFAAFAPPPPPTPTAAVPTPLAPPPAVSTPTPSPTAAPTPVAMAVAGPYCRPGEQPEFRFGFAGLSARLAARMGRPTSCEYGDPRGSGDTLQNTERGLAFYRQRTNTPTFTTGFEHWAITPAGVVYWTGDSIDPIDAAQPFED